MRNNKRLNLTPAAISAAGRGDLDNFAVAAIPGGIEAQEAAGQATFCANQTLPKNCPRAELEMLGFKFGKDYDDIFVNVAFPHGWKKRATDHSMHSYLIDDKGRKRGSIFYKAAFYDRNASMHLVTRYSIEGFIRCNMAGHPTGEDYQKPPTNFLVAVMDCDTILHSIGVVNVKDDYEIRENFRKQARLWLDEKFPEWNETRAYWD